MKREIFTTQKLSNGDVITIYKMFGIDLFNAMLKCNGQVAAISFYIIVEVAALNGERISLEYIHALDAEDAYLLFEIVNAQMLKVKKA